MDPDALQNEVEAWVQDGIITNSQANEILLRYDADEPRRSRAIMVLSLVGAALIFVGVTLFLGTNWEELSPAARSIVLIAGPGLAYAGGITAFDRNANRIGHALTVLGAILVGPSIFLFVDLIAIDIAVVWLLFVWTAVALLTGHTINSRLGTGFGLLILVALTIELVSPVNAVPVIGFLGVILFVLSYTHTEQMGGTYRIGGPFLTLGALLLLTTFEGRFSQFDFELSITFISVIIGALVGGYWLRLIDERNASSWAIVACLVVGFSVACASLAPELLPELLAFVGTHGAVLVGIIATGYLGYRSRSRALIDLAALGGLFQTLSFVAARIVDSLSGSIALVIAGLILLAVGLALERGRRILLNRF